MLKKINYVLDRRQKINLLFLLLIIFVGAFVELLGVSAILPVVNVATSPETIEQTWYLSWLKQILGLQDAGQMLIVLSVILIIIYILKNVYVTMMYNMQYSFIFGNQKKLAVKLMDCYMHQDYLFHVSKNVAELQRNVTSDVNGFFTVVLNFLQFLAEISVCIVLVLYLLMQDFVTTMAVAILLFVFVGLFAGLFKKILGEKGRKNREVNVQVTKWILQSFSGIKEIKVINAEDFFIYNYNKYYSQFATLQRQQSMLTFVPRPVMETVCICGLLIAVILKLTIDSSDIASFIPTLSVFAIAAFRMLPSFNRITGYLGGIMFSKPSIDAIYQDLKEVEQLQRHRESIEKNDENMPLTKLIQMNQVSFKYPESDKWILKNADIEIKKNSSVAFVGASGAGKTTAADLILGLLEPTEGRILVDGTDIRTNMAAWHEKIGYIPQTIYLMDDTIRANIAFGIDEADINEAGIYNAIKEAQLDEFIAQLPDGIETEIGDRGVKLSGGQRQRIGIARALYRNPEVLVLDEATSALDNDTEKEVMEAIDSLHGTRTLIVIAHRLSTIQNCDEIYEVGNGKFQLKSKQEVLGNNE
ncbi:MAG TPA: ABC transporter ATP-binding protein [Lachnospiraceae bacterium]|nr:ABC transporter ATP-binding protein [Lachnospiraceae bacterium]